MADELKAKSPGPAKSGDAHPGGPSGAIYGLGMIGAWVYYIERAATAEERVKGFFKGLVWPAFLVYELFEFLHKDLAGPGRSPDS